MKINPDDSWYPIFDSEGRITESGVPIRLKLAAEMMKNRYLELACYTVTAAGKLTVSDVMDGALLMADDMIARANRDEGEPT